LLIVGFMIMLLAMFLMVLVFLISGDFASVWGCLDDPYENFGWFVKEEKD
jgi:hypothetical protein